MRNQSTNEAIRDHAVDLMAQLITYNLPVPVAIQEGWHLIYDMVTQTTDDENPFENHTDASAILNWSIIQLNKDFNLQLTTDPKSWMTRKR